MLRQLGYGYRLHIRSLPGNPDIVMKKHACAVIQVRGCLWHLHDCPNCRVPSTNTGYWLPKLEANRERDRRNDAALREMGWRVLVVWECELGDDEALRELLRAFVENDDT